MTLLFLVCACLGGTMICCQFLLTLFGLGHSDLEIDGDISNLDAEVLHDAPGHVDHAPVGHAHGSDWLFGVLTFRTLTAAITFFGLAGYAADTAQVGLGGQIGLALVAGVAALYGVHWLMKALVSLREDGTLRIERAVGQNATVYLTVPAKRAGSGKIQFKLQNRLVEYEAITDHEEALKTGSKVRVVGVLSANTLAIMPQEHATLTKAV
jgi:membrane protein implicated in regulation of membrane protease activity